MTRQKIISGYLRQLKRNCPYSFRKKLAREIKSHLLDFLDDNPDSTLEDITEHFGPPGKFADEYLLAMDEAARKKTIQKTRGIKWGILAGAVAVVIITTLTASRMLVAMTQRKVYYVHEYITESNTAD